MHFCQQRVFHPDPTLTLSKDHIPVVQEFKFHWKLTFKPNIQYIPDNCRHIKGFVRTYWGSSRNTSVIQGHYPLKTGL